MVFCGRERKMKNKPGNEEFLKNEPENEEFMQEMNQRTRSSCKKRTRERGVRGDRKMKVRVVCLA
jgi:hypothetical protein